MSSGTTVDLVKLISNSICFRVVRYTRAPHTSIASATLSMAEKEVYLCLIRIMPIQLRLNS